MQENSFYTFSEYMKKDENCLTASMEDYLEMIYRLSGETGFTRIHELSEALNVQPPSATKMVQRLSELNLLNYERYGVIMLKDRGKVLGCSLLNRHNIIESFLSIIGVNDKVILAETEKVDHTLSDETVSCLKDYVKFIDENKDVKERYENYKKAK